MSFACSKLVWNAFPGNGSELLVMLAMANWSNDQGGNIFPSVASVAKRIRTSESQARRVLHRLIAADWISVVGNECGGAPGSTRRYVLNIPKLAARASVSATASLDATPHTHAREGTHGCDKTTGAGASQNIKKQESISVNKKVRAQSWHHEIGVDALVSQGVARQHAEDWLKVRCAKRAPLTATAWTDVEAEAAKAGVSSADAVRIAASNSWLGFKASWLEGWTGKPRIGAQAATKHRGFEERVYGDGGVL